MGNLKSKTVQVSGDETSSKGGKKLNKISRFFKSGKKAKAEKPAEGTENGKVVEDTEKDGEAYKETKAVSIDVEASVCPNDTTEEEKGPKPADKETTEEQTTKASEDSETKASKTEVKESTVTSAETTHESSATTVTVTETVTVETKETDEATTTETSETKTEDTKEEEKTESSEAPAEEQAAQ